jgi:UDP-N-acetylmuramoyl-tripeptide--D-alanyl-D-alanine ligase
MNTEKLFSLFRKSKGVSTDSRTVSDGQIFFGLRGVNFNGNKYAGEAVRNGASISVIDDPAFESEKTFLVDDTLSEFQNLATYYRNQLNVPVLAITGTNGKTTTKELIAAVLSKKLRVHSTKGNLNNDIGVPLTILSAPADTQMMIIEMGANHLREIEALCEIARPDYGLITNIGSAHLEGFGSFEGVIKAKTELYAYLSKVDGVAIFNDQNPLLSELVLKLAKKSIPYSSPAGIKLQIEALPSEMTLEVKVKYNKRSYNVRTGLFGKHNLENVKATIAAGLLFGVPIDDILPAIGDYRPANNRSQVRTTASSTLICDSYNANPVSMMMAIKSFSELYGDDKLVILGDMLELGEKSDDEHLKIIKALKSMNFSDVLLVGSNFMKVAGETVYKSFINVSDLIDYLQKEAIRNKLILIKGSRGMTLEKVYDFL